MFRATHLTHLLTSLAAGLMGVSLSAQGRAIAGQVLDGAGEPVAGVTVKLVSVSYPGLPAWLHDFLPLRGPAFEAAAKTDDNGRFRIVPENRHMICLYVRDGSGDATRMTSPVVPALPGDYRVLKLEKAAVVSGVVRGSDDNPLAGVKVHGALQIASGSGFGAQDFILGLQTVSDKTGSYTLRVPVGSSLKLEAFSDSEYLQKVPVTPGPDRDLVMGTGQVIEGTIRGPGDKPVAGVLLQDPYMPRHRTHSDEDGRFKLRLGVNRYWLHVAHPQMAHGSDYLRQTKRVRVVGGKRQVPKPKGRAISLKSGTRLRARIVRRDGKPLAGARVVLGGMPKRFDGRGMLNRILAWPTQLNDNGVLETSCMYTGYVAYVWVEVDREFVPLFAGDVGRGIDMGDVKLPFAGRLAGVVQLSSRMPAAGVRVMLRRRADNALNNLGNMQLALPFLEAATDRGGRFRVEGLRPGTYELAVAAPSHLPHLTEATVSSEEQLLHITLPKGNTIRGTLVDADDRPVPHRPIRIVMQNYQAQHTYRRWGFQMFEPVTDKEGRWMLSGLPDGHRLRAYVYFRIDGQFYRGTAQQNLEPDAQDVELRLTTPMPKLGVRNGR